jgi:hypothetical protein
MSNFQLLYLIPGESDRRTGIQREDNLLVISLLKAAE